MTGKSGWRLAALCVLLAAPLAAETATRPFELAAGTVLLAVAVIVHRGHPLVAVGLPLTAAVVSALVLAPTASNPASWWPFAAAALFAFLAGLRLGEVRPMVSLLAGTAAGALVAGVLADQLVRGGFGLLFGLYDWFLLMLALVLVVVLPWLAGRYRRQRAELVAAGWERAELLESRQRLAAEHVRLRERARIAQDMHDSLGHEWVLIALKAAALQVNPGQDVAKAAGELRAGIATATERLREVIGLLSTEDEEPELTTVIDRAREAGVTVHWNSTVDIAGLPRPIARAVAHIARECLTNAVKHAPGATVTVTVAPDESSTEVSVTNGVPTGPPVTTVSSGMGLAGLAERVRLLGGTLTAGPRDGGFALTAQLPHDTGPRPPETASARAQAQAKVRRGLVELVRIPLLSMAVAAVLGMGLYFLVGTANSLDSRTFDGLSVGAAQEEIEARLPPFQILGDPESRLPSPSPGASCRYYWAEQSTQDRLLFRLCFADGRLSAKDVFGRGALSGPRTGENR